MGLINNDVYTVPSNGVENNGTYISFHNETIYLNKVSTDSYSVRANYRIYWDKECRDMNMSFIDLKQIAVSLTPTELNNNIYTVLYTKLKELYPNSTDEISSGTEPVVPVLPVAPVAPVAPVNPVSNTVINA